MEEEGASGDQGDGLEGVPTRQEAGEEGSVVSYASLVTPPVAGLYNP